MLLSLSCCVALQRPSPLDRLGVVRGKHKRVLSLRLGQSETCHRILMLSIYLQAFTLARVVVVPLMALHVKSYATFTENNQLLWSNTVVSMLHSAVSSLLAIYALAVDHSVHGDYVNQTSYAEFVTTAISTGKDDATPAL